MAKLVHKPGKMSFGEQAYLPAIVGGVGLAIPMTRKAASVAVVVFFVAVFPAIGRMALERIPIDGVGPIPDWAAYARLPLQAVLMAWAWWVGKVR